MQPPALHFEVPELLTVQEVAAQLRVSTETVRRLVRAKELTALRISRSLRIEARSVGHYLARTATDRDTAA